MEESTMMFFKLVVLRIKVKTKNAKESSLLYQLKEKRAQTEKYPVSVSNRH